MHAFCSHINLLIIIILLFWFKSWEILELTHNSCSSFNRIVDSTTEKGLLFFALRRANSGYIGVVRVTSRNELESTKLSYNFL